MFSFISTLHAAEATAQQPSALSGFIPIFLIFGIFYFLLIRPQQKRIKEHNDMVKAIKKGDIAITSGGVMGKVIKVADDVVNLEIAKGVNIQVVRSTISNISDKKFEPLSDSSNKETKTKKNSKK